ncbi:MAG: efflux RND transporter permease subunit, partial [Bacilli bacterium]
PFDKDMDEVETQVNALIKDTRLPENVNPKVNRFSFGSIPIYNISLFAKGDTELESFVNDTLIPQLNKVQGINSVSVGGLNEEFLTVTVDKAKANAFGINLQTIKENLEKRNFGFPAGSVSDESLQVPIKVQERVDTIKAMEELPIEVPFPAGPGGITSVPLKDIATIAVKEQQSEYARYNLRDSLSMAITKKQDANTVGVADGVVEVLEKYSNQIDYAIGFDSAQGIKDSVGTLVKEGLLGALFASIAVLVFLRNIRATIIAIISIPLSILFATIFLNYFEVSLNIMTLGGMAVAVGRVVDDSIVVIENIFRRVRKSDEGLTNELIINSTGEILKAITSSTITTMVVFLPLGFVGGITGEFFLPFALTVVFSLFASLIVSITIVPILAKFSFKKVPTEEKPGRLSEWYGKSIQWALGHKIIVLVASLVLLVGSFAFVPGLGFVFIPNETQKLLVASVELPSSTPAERTNEISLEIEKMLDANEDVTEITASVGGRDFRTGLTRTNIANYFVTLGDEADVNDVMPVIEQEMAKIVDANVKDGIVGVQEANTGGPPTNNDVTINLYSNNLESLEKAASTVEAYMSKNSDLKYVTNNFSAKQKQYVVSIDSEKATAAGISNFMILGTINDQTQPVNMGTLNVDGKEQNVQLTYDKDLTTFKQLESIVLFGKNGPTPITAVAEVKSVEQFTTIQKLDGKVYAQVSAKIKGD